MSLRFIMMASGALMLGTLLVAPVAEPASATPLIGPHSIRQDKIVHLAACTKAGRECKFSSDCCSGNCVERGSKGYLCL
jgi:hypothetical protein